MKYNTLIFMSLHLFFSAIAYGYEIPSETGFIPNQGQWEKPVLYRISVPGGALFLEKDGFSYAFQSRQEGHGENPSKETELFRSHCIRMKLLHANENIHPEASNPSITKYNYFLGNDPENWATGLSSFQTVKYPEVYPSTDLKLYVNSNSLKYDFILKNHGDISKIKMKYEGAESITIRNEKLFIKTSLGEIIEEAPVAWQMIDGMRKNVPCQFLRYDDGSIGFKADSYDEDHELVIDPKIVFATYSGSIDDNWGNTGTYDYAGNGYAAGVVFGPNFQTTPGASQKNYGGGKVDIGIMKFSPDGKQAIFITYLGGKDLEIPHSIMVNQYNELFIFGTTGSSDFPVTSGSYSSQFKGGLSVTLTNSLSMFGGSDIFVSRLASNGQKLLASTLIGGTKNDGLNIGGPKDLVKNYADDIRGAIWVDPDNDVYIGTSTISNDFPISPNAFQPNFGGGNQDGIVFKMDGNLSKLIYSSFMGGEKSDGIFYLTVDKKENIIVTGGTKSNSFPISQSAYKKFFNGGTDPDAFASKIDSTGKLIASTYIGTDKYDMSFIVGNDNDGFIYCFGQTNAIGNEFRINSPLGLAGGNQFIMKLQPDLSAVVWSTNFGKTKSISAPDITPSAFMVDYCNKIYACGWGGTLNASYNGGISTTTTGLPTTANAMQPSTDGNDFYIYVIDKNASTLDYASFWGGPLSHEHVDGGTSRFDRKGFVYQAICAGCGNGGGRDDLPVTPGAYSATNNAFNCNMALVKFDFEGQSVVSSFTLADQSGQNLSSPVICAPFNVKFNNTSVNATDYTWEINGVTVSSNQALDYTFNTAGSYHVKLTAKSNASCNLLDTSSLIIKVISAFNEKLNDIITCKGTVVELGPDGLNDPYYNFQWYPSTGLSNAKIKKPKLTANADATYNLIVSIGSCIDTVSQNIKVFGQGNSNLPDLNLCRNDSVKIGPLNAPPGAIGYKWTPVSGLSDSTSINPFLKAWNSSPLTRTYTLAVQYNGCSDLITRKVNLQETAPDLSSKVCHGKSITLGPTQVPKDAVSYLWSPAAGLKDPAILNPEATTEKSTSYSLFIKGQYCNDTLIHQLEVVGKKLPPLPTIGGCPKDSIAIGLSTPMPEQGVTYQWNPANEVSDSESFNPKILVSSVEKDYQLIVKWPLAGCFDTLTRKVTVEETKAGFGYNFQPGCDGISVFFIDSSENFNSLFWKFSNGETSTEKNPLINIPYGDTLLAKLYSIKGSCKDSADQKIIKQLDDFYSANQSNAFSPNRDEKGLNECFSPALKEGSNPPDSSFVKCSSLIVYNRWGMKVFDSSAENKYPCWDGTSSSGDPMPTGHYFYEYNYNGKIPEKDNNKIKKTITGSVFLIRD